MDIALLADFIAPRSVQDTSHCKYSTTHLPKELQSLSPPNFSSYNCVNTSAQQAYLLEAELVSGGRVLATGLSAFVSSWCCIPQYVFTLWNMKHFSLVLGVMLGFFFFFPKRCWKESAEVQISHHGLQQNPICSILSLQCLLDFFGVELLAVFLQFCYLKV